MGNIRMSAEDSIQVHSASISRRWKLIANIVHQFGRFVVDLFFGDGKDLAEVPLDRGFHRSVALNAFQMYCAQDDEGGSRQDDGQLQC
jgi:hypothetical protein